MRKRLAFTLVELLVVVSIIALLVALLTPSLSKARHYARLVVCLSNLHQVRVATGEYQADFNGFLFAFANGGADMPHESQNPYQMPGNPALALVQDRAGRKLKYLPDGRLFFCPTTNLSYEKHYDRLCLSGTGTYWGTYTYYWKKVKAAEDPLCLTNPRKHQSEISNVNNESADVVMSETNAGTYWWKMGYEHYSAVMYDGSAKTVAWNTYDYNYWKWGPLRRHYPP